MSETTILILYYSRHGATKLLAQTIARGVEQVNNVDAILRTVPGVSSNTEATEEAIPESGDLYCRHEDLQNCSGLILGSPTRFGNMAAPLKYFIDATVEEWINGSLINKPAGVFTSTGSLHGGQESTLLSMMLPLIHQGMIYCGVPYSESSLKSTQTGGTPYGPTHLAKENSETPRLSVDEKAICLSYGRRIAEIAQKLINNK